MTDKTRLLELAASFKRMADELIDLAKEDDKEESDEGEDKPSSRGMAIAMLKRKMAD